MDGKIKGVIFDLDGVLIDTRHIHRDTFIQAVCSVALYSIDSDWHDRVLCGMTSRDKLKFLKDAGLLQSSNDEVILKTKDSLCKERMAELKSSLSKKLMMYRLKKLGIKLGCFTNCRRVNANQILKQIELLDYLNITVASDEVNKAKPDSEGYDKIISAWNLRPDEILIIEDSPHGVEAARKTGANLFVVQSASEVVFNNIEKFL